MVNTAAKFIWVAKGLPIAVVVHSVWVGRIAFRMLRFAGVATERGFACRFKPSAQIAVVSDAGASGYSSDSAYSQADSSQSRSFSRVEKGSIVVVLQKSTSAHRLVAFAARSACSSRLVRLWHPFQGNCGARSSCFSSRIVPSHSASSLCIVSL